VAKRKITARRQQYEAAFPTVTARVPAEVRERLLAALKAEGLTFSPIFRMSGGRVTWIFRAARGEGAVREGPGCRR
jgi:hypothetical protein